MNEKAQDRRNYVTGTILSAVLTLIAFATAFAGLGRSVALTVIAIAAVAQIAVQLRSFLHLGFRGQQREDLQLVLFSLLLLIIMAGGTMWILTSLSGRMM